ncbi:hypothetical protein HOLleu_16030 [Holothuria leucospilota]|uniref:Beta-microseminoprotein n=1 Tax=Holothuria leucospilota TaxID=206669 RepID=A0A9Q1C5J0_HOLLE|nr:hypothetical protein HOLleu_16030 [Holothuria leucospilota]
MKFILAFGLLVFCMHFCSPKIIPIPGMFVNRKPTPKWGECFRNTEIMCALAGSKVQYDGEKCVDCTCDGDNTGVTCCNVAPFPVVRNKEYCSLWLNTDTCKYERIKKDVSEVLPGQMGQWKHACCFKQYEIANLTVDGAPGSWLPDDPKP